MKYLKTIETKFPRLYVWYIVYRLNSRRILILLLLLLLALSCMYVLKIYAGDEGVEWLFSNRSEEVWEAGKRIFTPLVIAVAGIWTYYLFVRGRTFSYRAEILVEVRTIIQEAFRKKALLRIRVDNVGNVRLVLKRLEAKVSIYTENGVKYQETNSKLLDDYERDFEAQGFPVFALEPHTALKVDWLVLVAEQSPLLYLEITVEDLRGHVWLEKSILDTQTQRKDVL